MPYASCMSHPCDGVALPPCALDKISGLWRLPTRGRQTRAQYEPSTGKHSCIAVCQIIHRSRMCQWVVQAAHHEASALGAVTAWYRDVQRKHAAAGLGDDPIIASILPGSSRKLRHRSAPPGDETQAEPADVSLHLPSAASALCLLGAMPVMCIRAGW